AFMVGCLPNRKTRRLKKNVVSAQAIALDIDEGLSLEDCLKIPFVQKYAAAIYTSASHQKWKDGKPPCDRYRIIFILPEAVTDIPLYEQAVKVIMESVGYADKQCKDASRMFYGYDKTEVILCDTTKVLPAEFLSEVGDRLEQEKAERLRLFEERKRRREEYGDTDDQDELIQLALDCIDPDCPYDKWLAVAMALHSHDTGWFYLWDNWSSGGSK
ncbi:MAG: PriCT-2 domain-containing protein, partial [Limnothrix sp.]